MGRPSQKGTILDAALACFGELGYDATRVRHIAERAGVSPGALYRHYPSMQGLALALYAEHSARISEALVEVVDGEGTAAERAVRIAYRALAVYRERPDAFRFVLTWAPTFCTSADSGNEAPLSVLTRLVVDGQRSGEFRDGTPGMLACLVMGCIVEPIVVGPNAAGLVPDVLTDDSSDALIAAVVSAALRRQPE